MNQDKTRELYPVSDSIKRLSAAPAMTLDRRSILLLGASGAALAGCSFFESEPNDGGGGGSSGSPDGGEASSGPKPLEAPELAARVEAGELPELSERLPKNPLVVEPNDRIGQYGGTWTSAILGTADWPWLSRTVGYEALMRWSIDWKDVIPNVAESVEQSDDGREFAVTLREGLKWSDGEPFTADDVIFALEDVHKNTELYPALSERLQSGGEPLVIDRIDDYHFIFKFAHPNGMFMQKCLAMKNGYQDMFCAYPKHYFEQFHIAYNDAANEEAKAEGYASWVDRFLAKATYWENSEIPLLHPWIATSDFGEGSRLVLERNPYYFKVDPEGSQLPYLDSVSMEIIADPEVILLKASNGEFNFHTRHVMTPANRPVLAEAREAGNFEFIDLKNTLMNELIVSFNLNHPDEARRALYQNRDFRVGLSYAINRDEINAAVFQGQGIIQQAAPVQDSEFWDEELAMQYTEYDVDLANEYLDKAGLSKRDSDGYRLDENGDRVTFTVYVGAGNYLWHTPGTEMIVQNWQEVGIDARTETIDRGLLGTRIASGDFEATVFVGAGGYGEEMLEPRYMFPYSGDSQFAVEWAKWFSSQGTSGEEPPERVREQMEIYRTIEVTPSVQEQHDLFRDLLEITKEQFYSIGVLSVPKTYAIVANDFHNVPSEVIESDRYNTPGPTNPEQYFVE